MLTTADFLDRLRLRYALVSDGEAARLLGLTTASISKHRQCKSSFDGATALRVAELLELEPGFVLACAAAQAAKQANVRAAWSRLAELLGKSAAAIFGAVLLLSLQAPAARAAFPAPAAGVCILCQMLRRLQAWCARLQVYPSSGLARGAVAAYPSC